MKIERRELIAAGGLVAFVAGFSQTLGRMADSVLGKPTGEKRLHGHSAEPEYIVDQTTGEVRLNPNQQVSYTGCLGCTTLCGVRVRVDKRTGDVIRVTGNPYNPLSTEPHLPMDVSFKDSLVGLSRFKDKGLAGRSTACGRGNAALDQINSPFRVLTPMKRVGPRNSGQWEAISFEQLVQEVVEGGDLFGEGHVDGLRALRDLETPIDPNNPALGAKVNQVGHIVSVNDGRDFLARRFWQNAYGTLNYVGHGSYCGGSWRSGSGALFGDHRGMPHAKPDLAHAEFVIFIGTAPGNAGNPFKRTGGMLAQGRAAGRLEYVVVDPVLNNSDNRAAGDQGRWVPIRPGTDGALVLGMMRWLMENDRVNKAYLSNPSIEVAKASGEPSFTTSSWLVITEPNHPRYGRYLRGSNIGMDIGGADAFGDDDPYLVMNAAGEMVPVKNMQESALLEVQTTVEAAGKPLQVSTAYELLKSEVFSTDLETYAEDCGIDADVIAGLADEFSSHGRKACATAHGGMMSGAGFYNAFSVATLNALIGNLNWKGGYVMNGGGYRDMSPGPRYDLVNFDGKIQPKGIPLGRNIPYERTAEFKQKKEQGQAYPAQDGWFPSAPGLATEWFASTFHGYPYSLKAMIMWMANPLYGVPGLRERFGEDLADPKKLPLIVSIDGLINESNAFADYIVPDSMMYESWGWTSAWNGVPTKMMTARWPVIEPKQAKTADGQPICMESFVMALAKAMDLPGFGPEGLRDKDGNAVPLERAEDWFLRGAANIAYLGGKAVGDATDEDIAMSGVDRLMPAMKASLKDDEIRKVALLYSRGGRYEPPSAAQDTGNDDWQRHRFSDPLWVWSEHVGGARNAMTGKHFSGCATWKAPAFLDDTPMRTVYSQEEWPLLLVSYKSALQNSYSIATRITGLHPHNPVVVHPDDAAKLGLQTGDSARLETPGGVMPCTVLVHAGVMRGVIGVEHGYGHRELGARSHTIGGAAQPDRSDLAAGVNINDLGIVDPTRASRSPWVDSVSGAAVRNGLPGRLLNA
ncbi:MAG: molybdopterin dinucleotide binding domain-containing protein [Paenalcaligenes sp.]